PMTASWMRSLGRPAAPAAVSAVRPVAAVAEAVRNRRRFNADMGSLRAGTQLVHRAIIPLSIPPNAPTGEEKLDRKALGWDMGARGPRGGVPHRTVRPRQRERGHADTHV